MPSLILVQLIGLFALIVLANSFPLWIATGPDWRDRPSTPRLIVEFPLANINLAALALTYALVKTRRWRADWRAFQNASSELLERFATDEALNDPCGTLDRIPEEPPNIYLEVPPQPLVRWDRKQPGTEWLDRDNAEYLLVACAFRLLADLGLRGAYVGCSYHDTDRLGAVFDSTPVRALKTRRRGGLPVYTFRVDGERTHLVATFVVQRNGNIFTLAWHAVALRSTPLESVLQVGSWSVFSFVGIAAAEDAELATNSAIEDGSGQCVAAHGIAHGHVCWPGSTEE